MVAAPTLPVHLAFLGTSGTELLVLVLLVVVAVGTTLGWLQARRLEARLDRLDRGAALDRLVELAEARAKQGGDRGDGRRVEHVMVEVRDGIKRLDQTLMTFLEKQATLAERPSPDANTPPNTGRNRQPALAERVVNRLLALGYEGVQLVPDREELERIFDEDGDAAVEVRRDGALYRGRVEIRDGVIQDVVVRPFYSLFP